MNVKRTDNYYLIDIIILSDCRNSKEIKRILSERNYIL